MLLEIFKRIQSELQQHLESSPTKKKLIVTLGEKKRANINLGLLKFGSEVMNKNYLPPTPASKAVYSFTFYVVATATSYSENIKLIEMVGDFFEKKPFLQVQVEGKEYEMALSMIEFSIEEINHFWIAQQQKHQPVIFYQARVSEI